MDHDVLTVVDADPNGQEAQALIAELDAEVARRYPGGTPHGIDTATLIPSGGAFVIAWRGDAAVGCGALRPLESGVGEIKRMFVSSDARRLGVARRILAALEQRARERGWGCVRLETGQRQPEAIALYASAGYRRIPRFREYASDPLSVCFEKMLGPT